MTRQFAVLLTPGASATRDHAGLVALATGLTAEGHAVRRVDFTGKGKRQEKLIAFINEQAAALQAESGMPVVIGGRSFGGRMCSNAVATGLKVSGLLLLSYPLHPPGRPIELRTAHFGSINTPTLFVSGTKDAFGSPDEFANALKLIPGPAKMQWVEGGNHGMRKKDEAVLAAAKAWLAALQLKA